MWASTRSLVFVAEGYPSVNTVTFRSQLTGFPVKRMERGRRRHVGTNNELFRLPEYRG